MIINFDFYNYIVLGLDINQISIYVQKHWSDKPSPSFESKQDQTGRNSEIDHLRIPNDGTDEWEIDPKFLILDHKVASGSYGDL